MSKRRRKESDTDDEVIYNMIGNALTFFDDAEMICRMIRDKTNNKRTLEMTKTLCPLFGMYRDDILSALPIKEASEKSSDTDSDDNEDEVAVSVLLRATSLEGMTGKGGVKMQKGPSVYVHEQMIEAEPDETIFAWVDTEGELEGISVPRRRNITEERIVLEWLKDQSKKRGGLIICSGGGIGGFSDPIVNFLRLRFQLPLFSDMVGDEAYIGISTSFAKKSSQGFQGNEESSSDAVLTKEIVLRF